MFNDQLFDDTVGSVANAEATLFGSYVELGNGSTVAADVLAVGSETTLTVADSVSANVSVLGANVEVTGGAANDYITIGGAASGVKVNTGAGADTVLATVGDGVISLGADNDYITISGGNYTVNAGAGNDSIYVGSDGSVYIDGLDGLDTIEGFGSGVTINAGSDATLTDTGSGVQISSGSNSIFLASVGSSDISGTNGVYVFGSGSDTTSSPEPTPEGSGSNVNVVSGSTSGNVTVGSDTAIAGSSSASLLGYEGSAVDFGSAVNSVSDLTSGSVTFTLDENGNLIATTGSQAVTSEAIADVDFSVDSSTGLITATYTGGSNVDEDATLNFGGGAAIGKVNADFTKSAGNFAVNVGNIASGNLKFSEESKIAAVFSGLKTGAKISMSGGANDNNPDSGNTFYATSDVTVSTAADQAVITITDISFNASDVLKVDAGIENLTKDFFGTGKFYNYASAEEASTAGVYSNSVLDASALVESIGTSFSMLRMADGSASLDDENAVDESAIYNVVWANAGSSATIDFSNSQNAEVIVFTDTNGKNGDIVSLGGDYNDTIHAGKNDTINAGGGDDLIDFNYSANGAYVVFDATAEGNDTVTGFVAGDVKKGNVIAVEGSAVPTFSLTGGNLMVTTDTATMLIDGSENFSSTTDFKYNLNGTDGVLRVADNGTVTYDKDVTYYAGTDAELVVDTSRTTTIDLSTSTYANIANVDASDASGKLTLLGDSDDNVLYGGTKASTLWGGGGNDTLIGGDGKDTFQFTASDGNVTIQNGASNDVIDMSSFTVSDIASYDFTNSGLVITTSNTDQSLTINGTNLTNLNIGGTTYTIDYANGSITQA
ncbi:MAG: hypothetical protein IJ575_11665 [Selenomonadaceae bacterium]|nr:hypothetical protein [Selenomonadaceae bacterium]